MPAICRLAASEKVSEPASISPCDNRVGPTKAPEKSPCERSQVPVLPLGLRQIFVARFIEVGSNPFVAPSHEVSRPRLFSCSGAMGPARKSPSKSTPAVPTLKFSQVESL